MENHQEALGKPGFCCRPCSCAPGPDALPLCSSLLLVRGWNRWGMRPWLALRAYGFISQSTIHLCEPLGKNGRDSSCSLKNHFNSWHKHLTFLKMEKYREESMRASLRVREGSQLCRMVPQTQSRRKPVHAIRSLLLEAPAKQQCSHGVGCCVMRVQDTRGRVLCKFTYFI